MAKQPQNRGPEGQNDAPPPAPAPAAAKAEAPAVPKRRAALCLEACVVCLGLGTNQIFGGEWITDQQHVALIAHDPHFEVIEGTHAELADVIAKHQETVKVMTQQAKKLGMVISRHGELTVARKR